MLTCWFMRNFSSLFFFLFLFIFLFFAGLLVQGQSSVSPLKNHNYYVNNKGSDSNSGDKSYPFHSIDHINKMRFSPGDKIFFSGGQNFHGKLTLDSSSGGLENNPISLDAYGRGKANIYSGAQLAISLYKKNYLLINHLHLIGAGRKLGNHSSGLALINCKKIILKNCEINGFQKSGLQIFASEDIVVDNIVAHDNGYAGISVEGNYQQKDSKNILIQNSKAFNNPGDPTNLTSHSGNGIVVGSCKGVVIHFCTATANGWDMPRTGNGPVGIWAFEADSILIQHCISYKNRTSKGGEDGGGFDLDGGVTNSIIQYCLSYGNEGSGFGIFQYAGASPWYNNTIRCNISENDGNVSTAKASVYIWNGSKNKNEFTRCYFYNNTVYNAKGSAIIFL